jgi:hypothetical protein
MCVLHLIKGAEGNLLQRSQLHKRQHRHARGYKTCVELGTRPVAPRRHPRLGARGLDTLAVQRQRQGTRVRVTPSSGRSRGVDVLLPQGYGLPPAWEYDRGRLREV